MSLFPDEKTKEEKFRKYCHENNCDNTPFRLTAYLAGWNECEKHVRESASDDFDEWIRARHEKMASTVFANVDEAMSLHKMVHPFEAWQACSIMKDKELSVKDRLISGLELVLGNKNKEIAEKDKRIKLLEGMVENGLGWEDMKNEI